MVALTEVQTLSTLLMVKKANEGGWEEYILTSHFIPSKLKINRWSSETFPVGKSCKYS